MFKNKTNLGVFLVCLAAAMWGFDGVVLTPRLWNLDVGYVVFMLHALPFLGMNFILFREYKTVKTLSASDMIYFALIALFGGALGTLAIVKALFIVEFKHLTVVALLQKLQPVFAILLARLLLKERIGRNFTFWTSIALIGGYFLTFEFHLPSLVNSGKMLPAAGYALIAAFSFGSATVFGKRVLNKVSFQTALFYRYGLTTLIMLVIVLLNGRLDQLQKTTAINWTFFVIIGLTTGSGAILIYYYGLRYIKANVSTMAELCFPVSSVVFDYLINGSVLSPVQWVSALTMVFAIYKISNTQVEEAEPVYKPSKLCQV
ncbi:DMT family transporter [candidate division KSB1 bacterium]|nr:DMT family transporter [candidate division KSB1 bacterium]